MTASRKPTTKSPSDNSGSNGGTARGRAASAAPKAGDAPEEHGGVGTLTALPSQIAEKTTTAAQVLRSTAGRAGLLWTLVRARKAVAAGTASGTFALVAASYAAGRRAGLRRRGPLSRLTGGRL
ncbi:MULTISPECIES: hypothetical protein [Streptomyces]|jgi:hypothetical protein|uniref:hypothetical protein n=1 Tax=Streptomyces TaxID=1883 RepID=UPI000F73531A|nr:hypothetical protein [Streptomyces sp. WAC05292]RSS80160.1 hypothetical protein EF903_30520 [Streptomyces sp. WAC05292]